MMVAELKRDVSDQMILMQLNQEYVNAFMNADVEWYQKHLTEDFEVIESDGSVLNKGEFLSSTAKGPDVTEYKLQDVNVRILGNVALIRATGLWIGRNGYQGLSRYTDVYVKTEDGWRAISAQITRAAAPEPRGRYKRPRT
jgi:ketosteroid isomerase-like protein